MLETRELPKRDTHVIAYSQLLWMAMSLLVACLLIYLRLNHLATNPGWYPDEGSNVNMAHHMAEGRWQYYALGGTPLVAARMPLFPLFVGWGTRVWGYDIATARFVVALFGFATILLLFIATAEMLGRWTALVSALMLGILPNSLLYSRIAFDYNVEAFFIVLCWYALWKFYLRRKNRWLGLAVAAAVGAYMTALTSLALVACVTLVGLFSKPRAVIWALPLMLAPGLVYLGSLYLIAPTALQQDLTLTFERTAASLWEQFFNLVSNYVLWFDWTFWIALGVSGLFLIPVRAVRWITLCVFFSILVNVMRAFQTAGDLNLHRYIGLMPFLALGAAQFLVSAGSFLRAQIQSDLQVWRAPARLEWFQKKARPDLIAFAFIGCLLGLLLLWLATWDVYLVSTPLAPRPTRLDFVSVTNPADARQVAEWVNARTQREDVVLASPTIAWLLDANAADFQQALAFEGIATANYATGLPRARFLYDVSFENARFVIVDRLWRGWAVEIMPELRNSLKLVQSWRRVYSQGEFEVYQNPSH